MKNDYILDEEEVLKAIEEIMFFLSCRVSELERYVDSIDRLVADGDEGAIKDKRICEQLGIMKFYAAKYAIVMESISSKLRLEIEDLIGETRDNDNFKFPKEYSKSHSDSNWTQGAKDLNVNDRIKDELRYLFYD